MSYIGVASVLQYFQWSGSKIDCWFRIVHGSLARAGKVKSQTPKVEKQEKKKTPKGRAKKRILYNRRCAAIDLMASKKCN